jgi:hypothetical protein
LRLSLDRQQNRGGRFLYILVISILLVLLILEKKGNGIQQEQERQ